MNFSMILYILGQILKIEAAFMLLPCLTALIYKEDEGFVYLAVATIAALLGWLMTVRKPKENIFYLKEGCVATALGWILLSFIGALPFFITGEIPSFTDALFETVSGFTTTGASILGDVESLTHCTMLWRSFTHWIGGMGVLVFLLAVVPMSGGSHMNLMRAESPGPSVGKLVPKVKHTARILYIIYIGLTILQIILLCFGDMPLFEAVNTAFATAGTGGFGIKNDSFASYSPYLQWVTTIFMILFGVNFNAYYILLFSKLKKNFFMEEVRYYFLIVIGAIGIIFVNILETSQNAFKALTDASFQVASIITTTGFATADFNKWSGSAKTILVLLMFIGACAGSTGGGIKVSRVIIMVKSVFKECHSYIHPKSIKKIKFEGKEVEHDVVRATNVYLITFIILFVLSVFALSFEGHDLITNFTAVTATINNIGPGLELVGPTQNFGFFSDFSKFVLMFDMLAGRLELFPLLILFHYGTWKDIHAHRKALQNK
ncbi:MAG: TrkH family potassium uptake protein [Lachnospiraceae bacterium]|nr:TrkH family potassium uptake protein [Lachnospiraceae bacterium]